MKCDVISLDNQTVDSIDLDDTVFGAEPRADLLQRVVRWQLAKRRAGTHQTKTRSMVSGGGKKPFRQKGTGHARQGSKRSPQFRGGGHAMARSPRDYEFSLPKKVRRLGLKTALSTKAAEGKLVILDKAQLDSPKTKALAQRLSAMGWTSALIIGGEEIESNFGLAARNIAQVDVLPQAGANVYDILRRETLVLTREAVQHLEARLK